MTSSQLRGVAIAIRRSRSRGRGAAPTMTPVMILSSPRVEFFDDGQIAERVMRVHSYAAGAVERPLRAFDVFAESAKRRRSVERVQEEKTGLVVGDAGHADVCARPVGDRFGSTIVGRHIVADAPSSRLFHRRRKNRGRCRSSNRRRRVEVHFATIPRSRIDEKLRLALNFINEALASERGVDVNKLNDAMVRFNEALDDEDEWTSLVSDLCRIEAKLMKLESLLKAEFTDVREARELNELTELYFQTLDRGRRRDARSGGR